MVATLSFFWNWVATELAELKLTGPKARLFKHVLLLIGYLELQIPKSKNAEERSARRALHASQMKKLENDKIWQSTTAEEKEDLIKSARRCALIFQRSSSCVEGRNGQLSLMHHSSRAINPRRLSSLTVVHNYFIRRHDKTTAAERFFEQKHDDLFLWLLDRVDCPALPAKKGVVRRRFDQVA